jgi:cation:H+ antiporter
MSSFPIEVAIPLFILSAGILAKGADIFTDGATRLARAYKVSEFLIGTTLVAVATSLPELGVSGVASVRGAGEIALSNVIGSNIANIAFVLGVVLLIRPLISKWLEMRRDVLFMLAVGGIGALVIFDKVIQRWEALALVVLYGACTYVWVLRRKKVKGKHQASNPTGSVWLRLVVGALAIYVGAEFMVRSALEMCVYFGVAQTAIGLTLVALSTSLPEAATSAMAARKRAMGMAIGNVVGSNIFNILVVLGVAGTLAPISLTSRAWSKLMLFNIPLMLGLSILLIALVRLGRIPRKLAPALLACYAIFVWWAYV